MKTLETFDFSSSSNRGTYDWDSILDGKIHVLEVGKDFECKVGTIKTRARTVAKKMGLGVRTGLTKEGNVVVQSYEKTKEAAEFEAAANKARAEKKAAKAPKAETKAPAKKAG